ncbi:hypothetical protein GCM10025876_07310 [Demequina litorisediminis]|uniref:Short chain dehydrogenase n=1 Tax=Demequina litorisediminis TaxID=1849022 RepID=A0ABQ6I9J8_9MICO|nr:hypothetical protein GCM10025876_07310 [Demequina litorisediminis]
MKTIVITGASDGIGAAAAHELSRRKHRVIIVGRDAAKTAAVAQRLGVESHVADFSDLAQVSALASALLARHERIDVLANNAGGVMGERSLTGDGFEKTFQVNHLAPFLLTREPDARAGGGARDRHPDVQRCRTALCAFRHRRPPGRARLLGDEGVRQRQTRQHSVHRGTPAAPRRGPRARRIPPRSRRHQLRGGLARCHAADVPHAAIEGADQDPAAGRRSLVWLATATPRAGFEPGGYYVNRALAKRVNPLVGDATVAAQLWDRSEALLAS